MISIFEFSIWLSILFSLITVYAILLMSSKFISNSSNKNLFWNLITILFINGTNNTRIDSNVSRIIIFFWIIYCSLLYLIYLHCLSSLTILPYKINAIDSINQLAIEVDNKIITPYSTMDSSDTKMLEVVNIQIL